MSTVITPFQGTDPFSTATFNNRISQINTGFSYISNPNLLDSWYFADPVDQRGGYVVPPGTTYYYAGGTTVAGTTAAYYTVKSVDTQGNATFEINGTEYWCVGKGVRGYVGEVYSIDRWIAQWTGDGVTLIEDGCISIYRASHDSHICQRITDDLGGQTVTVSAICKGTCTIKLDECDSSWAFKSDLAKSAAVSSNDYTLITATGVVPQGCKNLIVEIVSARGVKSQFKAAKLELGTQQTLAHQDENGVWVLNEIPNYGEQLRRCQRYFIELNPNNVEYNTVAVGVGWSGGTEVDFVIPIPTTMRANPTIVNLSNFHCVDTTDISWHNFTSANCYLGSGVIKIVGFIDASVSGRTYALMCDKNSLKMHLSADL